MRSFRSLREVVSQIVGIADGSSDEKAACEVFVLRTRPLDESPVIKTFAFETLSARESTPGTRLQLAGVFVDPLPLAVQKHTRLRGDGDNIMQAAILTETPEFVVRTVNFIGGDPLRRNARFQSSTQYLTSKFRLRGERDGLGNLRFMAASLVVGPLFRKILTSGQSTRDRQRCDTPGTRRPEHSQSDMPSPRNQRVTG